jgi:hypothetical protein
MDENMNQFIRFMKKNTWQTKIVLWTILTTLVMIFLMLSIYIHFINKGKNEFALKFLFNHNHKSFKVGDNKFLELRANGISCSTNPGFRANTVCTSKSVDVYMNNVQLGTAKNVSLLLKTGLLDTNIPEYRKSGVSVNLMFNVGYLNYESIFGISKIDQKSVTIFNNSNVIVNLDIGSEHRLKDGTTRAVEFDVKGTAKNLMMYKKFDLDLESYKENKVLKLSSFVNKEDQNKTSESNLYLPYAKILKENTTMIAFKDYDTASDLLYDIYSYNYDSAFDKVLFNQNYLDLSEFNKVSKKELLVSLPKLIKRTQSRYLYSEDAPILSLVTEILKKNSGVKYSILKKKDAQDIPVEFIDEIGKIDGDRADSINRAHYDREIKGCGTLKECDNLI